MFAPSRVFIKMVCTGEISSMPRYTHHHRSRSPRSSSVDERALAAAVGRVMLNPAFNVQWLPDMIEFHIHKKLVTIALETLARIPPIEIYGHQLRIVLEPVAVATTDGE